MELALHKLHSEISAEEILLWGKINGLKNDYYIAMGLTYTDQFEFMQKKFYYCMSNDFNFLELPELNDQHVDHINRDKGFFTGEPNRLLIEKKEDLGDGVPEPNEEEKSQKEQAESEISEEDEIKIPPKDLTEKDRVKFVVCAIENDC